LASSVSDENRNVCAAGVETGDRRETLLAGCERIGKVVVLTFSVGALVASVDRIVSVETNADGAEDFAGRRRIARVVVSRLATVEAGVECTVAERVSSIQVTR